MSAYLGNIPETLRAIRKSTGMTQRDLGNALGEITTAYVNDIEHGRRRLPDDRILAVKATGLRSALIGARIGEYQAIIEQLRRARDRGAS